MPRVDNLTPGQRRKLEEIRSHVTMDNASFKLLWPDPEDPLPKTEAEGRGRDRARYPVPMAR